MHSIQRTLLGWTLGALTLGGMVVALTTYLLTLEEMHEVFDADLKNVAQGVAAYHQAASDSDTLALLRSPVRNDVPEDVEIVTLSWRPSGEKVFSSDPRVPLPFTAQEGLHRAQVQGEEWIIYSNVSAQGVAQAAQSLAARQQMASESALKMLSPLLALVVGVGAMLVYGLRRGLQSLDVAARDVASRSARSLEPIAVQGTPREITPLVLSINGLMARLEVALSAQRRFTADAAHELRTPVTALRLQLQLLQRSETEAERKQAISELGDGIQRSQRLIEQLLHVARSDPDAQPSKVEAVDLSDLVRVAVGAFSAKAEALGLDLGAELAGQVRVQGDAEQLRVLLDNLLENALRYTPRGGVVDVSATLQDGRPTLQVTDNGPGIPLAERQRVFDRFYRGEDAHLQARDHSGSGLGLAIVKAIAERHGARLDLADPPAGQGLRVRLTFGSAAD